MCKVGPINGPGWAENEALRTFGVSSLADVGGKVDHFDFDLAGGTLDYISSDEAWVLAIQHARDNTDFYGSKYREINLAWELVNNTEGDDYYDVTLKFRPAGRFRGDPGLEQIVMDKTGIIQFRQIMDEPTDLRATGAARLRRPRWSLGRRHVNSPD